MKNKIFISYKYSDHLGNPTRDFEIASKLYELLTNQGYPVFFSSSSLEKIGSSRYKADIDKALDESNIMIVVLTKAEYATSQWVQYEWDSFYNDYLSGVRKDANLFTLTENINIQDLPRTLRNIQNFNFSNNFESICDYISNIVPKENKKNIIEELKDNKIEIISGKQVDLNDIEQAIMLDRKVFKEYCLVDLDLCKRWFEANHDIYLMAKEKNTGRVIAYINIAPINDEYYEEIKKGESLDSELSPDMILSYDMPYPYSVYFTSIVIDPEYQNTEVFMNLFNAVIEKFIHLGEQEVFVKRILADAVTPSGEKFCKLFGMKKIGDSNHNSTLYEVIMMPPQFRILSKMTKVLYDYYKKKYEEVPYLFSNVED